MRALLAALLAACSAAASLPHLIVIVADDLGWHCGPSKEPSLLTPALDDLAAHGVTLSSFYSYKYCSPSRASLLSGRFPFKTESTRNNLIPFSQQDGVNLNFTMLPARLAAASPPYARMGVGKWHQGFWRPAYTPTARGFQRYTGFLAGGQDHFTQASFAECGCAARDVWVDGQPDADPAIRGQYNAFRFTAAATDAILSHNASSDVPLFLYVALQNTHAPIEADPSFSSLYPHETYQTRRDFSGMLSAVDSSVANITAALKAAGMWDNALVWWLSDNGTPVQDGGSNWPLRGSKGSNWEGGVRVPSVVGGGLLPAAMAGRNLTGLVHVSDVYATLLTLAGLPVEDGQWAPVDGLNQWPYLSGATAASPRTLIVHEHSMFAPGPSTGALRLGDWKLIVGTEGAAGWYGDASSGHFTPPRSGPPQNTSATACSAATPCLFNIALDPEERSDVAAAQPALVAQLLAAFRGYDSAHHPPRAAPPANASACCAASRAAGNVLSPWGA